MRVGRFERIALKHVYYHMWNRSPVQVWCNKQGTQSRCTGTTQRDGMGRELGGEFRMGDTCILMADSRCCVAEPNAILQSNYPPIKNLKRKNTISIIQSHSFKYHLCAENPPLAPSCILIMYANSLRDPSHWISHKPLQCIFTQNWETAWDVGLSVWKPRKF